MSQFYKERLGRSKNVIASEVDFRNKVLNPQYAFEYQPQEDITLQEIALLLPCFNMYLPDFEAYIERHGITRHFEKEDV